jgi:hypothetical protein
MHADRVELVGNQREESPMRVRFSRKPLAGALALVGALALSWMLAAAGAAVQAKQRIAIEERGGESAGTFVLIPLTPGLLKADSGTWMFTGATQLPTVIRNGQQVTRYRGGDAFTGKHGSFRLPVMSFVVNAGGGYQVGTQIWSFRNGTGVYAGMRGGGAGAFVAPPSGRGGDRFEGYLSTG